MAGAAVEGFDHSRSCHRGRYRDRCLAPPQRMKIMNIVWPSAGDCRRDRHPLGPDGRVKERGQDPARAGRTHEQGLVRTRYRLNIVGPRSRAKAMASRNSHNHLPPPPGPLLERFFASIKQHLTAKQPQAKAAREACGRVAASGLEASPRRRRRSQARMRPSLPTVVARAETCAMLPELLPE